MNDELIETKCEICGKVVYTQHYENGYDGLGYHNFKTLIPYEVRRIHLPESRYSVEFIVCLDCIKKEPSLHSLILNFRKNWFKHEIEMVRNKIIKNQNEIEELKESIPKLRNEIIKLNQKRKELK